MLKDIKFKKHKQSHYLTVMFVPYSQKKMISIKIPHWIFHILAISLTIIITTATIAYFRSVYFKSIANNINNDLQQSIQLNSELEERNSEAADFFKKKSKDLETTAYKERQSYEEQLEFYNEKSKDLEFQLEELNKLKNDIYNSINSLSYNSQPINELKSMLMAMENENGMGGEMPSNATLEERYYELEARISSETESLVNVLEVLGKIKNSTDKYPSIWPVTGRTTSEFGYRGNPFGGKSSEFHEGLDISVPIGTIVRATASGTVTFAGYSGGYGYLVKIDHGSGIETRYGHNSSLLVKAGDKVLKGDPISKSGNTGRSTGPHVHYEVRVNTILKNPRNYLQ